jgi:TonB family protein
MRQLDNNQYLRMRTPERTEDGERIAAPKRIASPLFQGWGPKLMAAALAFGALGLSNRPAMAANIVAYAACQDHGATLLHSPIVEVPDGDSASGEAILRVDLSATGQISAISIAQSSGDPLLDFEAMRAARQSRYSAASAGCKPAADQFLYSVSFNG